MYFESKSNLLSRIRTCFLLSLFFLGTGCSAQCVPGLKNNQNAPLGWEDFMLDPWSFSTTVQQFRENLPSHYRLKKFIHVNRNNPNLSDTIFKFYYHHSSFFVFKASGREVFVGGSISDPCIKMRNGIHVGMTRKDFYDRIVDLKPIQNDTVRLISKRFSNRYNFVFQKDILRYIKMDNHMK